MISFRVDNQEFSFPVPVVTRIPYLQGMLEYEGNREVANVTVEEMQAVYDCMVLNKIPNASFRDVFDFLSISPADSYPLSLCLEEEMRAEMYITPDEKYKQPHYGLVEVTEAVFNTFFTREVGGRDKIFTHRRLQKCTWSVLQAKLRRLRFITDIPGMIVAGGALFTALLSTNSWKPKDVDVFIYGCGETEAEQKITELAQSFLYFGDLSVKRSQHAVTFAYEKTPPVQVILRLYQTPSEIIHGFDCDVSSLCYHQGKLWCTERCLYALVNGCNTVNFGRMSPSYEYRLAKYGNRGIAVKIPHFDNSRVHSAVRGWYRYRRESTGLDLLLTLEAADIQHSIAHEVYRYEYELSDYATCGPNLKRHIWLDEVINWDADVFNFRSHPKTFTNELFTDEETEVRVKQSLSLLKINNTYKHNDFLEVSGPAVFLSLVLHIEPEVYDDLCKALVSYGNEICLSRDLEWKVTNPGEQMTNTFHATVLADRSVWYQSKFYCMEDRGLYNQ